MGQCQSPNSQTKISLYRSRQKTPKVCTVQDIGEWDDIREDVHQTNLLQGTAIIQD